MESELQRKSLLGFDSQEMRELSNLMKGESKMKHSLSGKLEAIKILNHAKLVLAEPPPVEDEGEFYQRLENDKIKLGSDIEFDMCYESGGIPWISTENMDLDFSEKSERHSSSGEVGIFEIVGISNAEVDVDRFLDHKGNDHVTYIYEDHDVSNVIDFVSNSHKKPRVVQFIAKAGAVAGAWGTILSMATYLPQETQWLAVVAAVIPTVAVVFA